MDCLRIISARMVLIHSGSLPIPPELTLAPRMLLMRAMKIVALLECRKLLPAQVPPLATFEMLLMN